MSIDNVMSQNLVTVGMDDSLNEVHTIFRSTDFHHLLVVENGRLVGMVSDRDLLKSISPNIGTAAETTKDTAALNKRVHQIMSRHLVTAPKGMAVYDVIDIFNHNKVSCIPIVDADNIPVGIVSWRDIFKLLKQGHHHAHGHPPPHGHPHEHEHEHEH